MDLKKIALKALRIVKSWRYVGRKPGEVIFARRQKVEADRSCRQRRKRWRYNKKRFPANSHRRM